MRGHLEIAIKITKNFDNIYSYFEFHDMLM